MFVLMDVIVYGRWTVISPAGHNKHKQKLMNCRCQCGTERVVIWYSLVYGKSKSCGCVQREIAGAVIARFRAGSGDKNHRWKGGRHKTRHGYVVVYQPDHPRCVSQRRTSKSPQTKKYVFEHILVMEKILGRYLLPRENVHHINGIKDDNRPENLELWLRSQPAGQRVSDIVQFAEDILRRYK